MSEQSHKANATENESEFIRVLGSDMTANSAWHAATQLNGLRGEDRLKYVIVELCDEKKTLGP